MIDFLKSLAAKGHEYYLIYVELTKGNEFLAATVLAGLTGALVWVLRGVPSGLSWLRDRFVFSIKFTLDKSEDRSEGYLKASSWLMTSDPWFARQWHSISVYASDLTDAMKKKVGYDLKERDRYGDSSSVQIPSPSGFFVIFHGGWMYWCKEGTLPSEASSVEKRSLTIYTFGFTSARLQNLFYEFSRPVDRGLEMHIHAHRGEYGSTITRPLFRKSMDSVIMNAELKAELLAGLDRYLEAKDWYHENDINWKYCILMSGPPGTGKTSLSRAIATYTGLPLHVLSLRNMSDNDLMKKIGKIDGQAIILVEEVDQAGLAKRQLPPGAPDDDGDFDDEYGVPEDIGSYSQGSQITLASGLEVTIISPTEDQKTVQEALGQSSGEPAKKTQTQQTNNPLASDHSVQLGLSTTLTGLLNTLDGVMPVDGKIFILTTNNVAALDEALMRECRTDFNLVMGYFTRAEVEKFIQYHYKKPDFALRADAPVAKDMTGAKLSAQFRRHPRSLDDFLAHFGWK